MHTCGVKRVYYTDECIKIDGKTTVRMISKSVSEMYHDVLLGIGYKSGGCNKIE